MLNVPAREPSVELPEVLGNGPSEKRSSAALVVRPEPASEDAAREAIAPEPGKAGSHAERTRPSGPQSLAEFLDDYPLWEYGGGFA